ncbi:MAG: aminoacyl-tRNA hydrolase [Rectinema sp.]|nr:aminoacyl-tRNA hydrolase [Rectinema sp.]
MIRMCVFLGNQGPEYRHHRHNVGWLFADALRECDGLRWNAKFKGIIAQKDFGAGNVILLKPHTFMNLSGESVVQAATFYRCASEEILVVHDELELPFGVFGYKFSGGLGGHNGLRSLERHLGTRDFWRLRFGIGRPEHPDVAGYVLSPFPADELEALRAVVFPEAEKTFYALFNDGIEGYDSRFKKVTTPVARPMSRK